jgi:hypothetical protein
MGVFLLFFQKAILLVSPCNFCRLFHSHFAKNFHNALEKQIYISYFSRLKAKMSPIFTIFDFYKIFKDFLKLKALFFSGINEYAAIKL